MKVNCQHQGFQEYRFLEFSLKVAELAEAFDKLNYPKKKWRIFFEMRHFYTIEILIYYCKIAPILAWIF